MPAAFPCGSGGTRHGFARALIFLFRCPPLFHAEAAERATASPVRSSSLYAFAQTCIVVLSAPKCKGEKTKIDEKLYCFLLSLTFSISVSPSSSRVAQLVAKRPTERVSS